MLGTYRQLLLALNCLICSLIINVNENVTFVDAYAYFLDCRVKLNDPTEVIMSSAIIPYKESEHKVVIQPSSQSMKCIWVDEEDESMHVSSGCTSIDLSLNVPPSLLPKDEYDLPLQYVMEVVAVSDSSNDNDKGNNNGNDNGNDNSSKRGFFVDDGKTTKTSMCNGRRAYGLDYNDRVKLKFNHSYTGETNLQIYAGYARNYEPVCLTDVLTISFQDVQIHEKQEL